MNTLFSAMANAQAQGIISGEGGVIGPAIKECAKKMVDEIESKCKADRKQLRRREFLGLISVLQTVPDGQPYVERAQKLMKDCVGKYRMLIEGTQYVNEGTIYNKIDATACGYLDDKQAWSGSLRVDISVSIAHQWTDAKVNFTLPSGGGGFGISVNGTHNAPGLISMTVPVNGTIQAYFDGQEKASAKIFSPEIIEGSIKLIDTKCELGGL